MSLFKKTSGIFANFVPLVFSFMLERYENVIIARGDLVLKKANSCPKYQRCGFVPPLQYYTSKKLEVKQLCWSYCSFLAYSFFLKSVLNASYVASFPPASSLCINGGKCVKYNRKDTSFYWNWGNDVKRYAV